MTENTMDNAAFERENSSTSVPVEMGEEGAMSQTPVTTVNATPVNGNAPAQCSEMCQSLHLQHQTHYPEKKPAAPPESPWHRLKTIFLIGIIIFLVLWIFVYTLLSQFHLL
ncbi:uncharacterized protein [Anabrus simplex]|uniref:uncharacterized protein n=1 Tax=Anabrus simplex TaxID=316456 RepID=UPI0035A28EF2